MKRAARSTLSTLIGICLALLLAAPARAQDDRGPNSTYHGWFHGAVLSRCDSVVVGRVHKVTVLANGERLVRASADQVLSGQEEASVLLAGTDERLLAFREQSKIFFLQKTRGETMRVLVDFVDLAGADAADRIEFLKRLLAVEGRQSGEHRIVGLRQLIYDHGESGSVWVRRILVRELTRLAARAAASVDGAGLLRLARFRVDDLAPAERRDFRSAVLKLEDANAIGWTSDRLVFTDAAAKESFVAALARFQDGGETEARVGFLDDATAVFGPRIAPLLARCLADRDPIVRRRAVYHLGELESGTGHATLLGLAAAKDEALELRLAVVDALQKIGLDEAVPVLIALVGEPTLAKTALSAIAAADTPECVAFLTDLDRRLRADPDSSADLRWHLTHIQGAEFREEVARARAARRALRPR